MADTLPPQEEAPPVVEPINILLVDDEPKNLMALQTVLENPAYRLVCAGSADEALLALVAEEFALLILDIQMPGMNGFELAQLIKQRKKNARVPIIFLTAYYSEDQHALDGYSTGAVDYLHKPINATILRSKVAVFADMHRKSLEAVVANRSLLAEISHRRRAEERLREFNEDLERRVEARTAQLVESEARFRALAENMPHLVWEADAAGVATFQNAKWLAYTGLEPAHAKVGWLSALHPDDEAPMAASWNSARISGWECDTCCRYRSADGEYRWFRVKTAPVRDGNGVIVRWVGTGTDIHEQRQAEEAMRGVDKRKDEFLAMLGHELRNPLSAIRHAVEIESDSHHDPESHQWAIDVIDRQSTQLTRMVDDLLDVARINRGRIELRRQPLELKTVLANAVEAVKPLVDDKKHTLVIGVQPGLCIFGDATRIQQVFVNVLSNAAKYTKAAGRIEIRAESNSKDAVISITDSGIGLSSEVMPRVFDLFTQAHTSLDRAQGGLGIGLTVAKSLVEMHGGCITVQSEGTDKGATFIVRLPLMTSLPKSATNENGVSSSKPPSAQSDVPPLRVLIVDDHRDNAETLSHLLRRRGCEIRTAHDGIEGFTVANEFHPEVLLLDLGLPGLDGYELCRSLRANPEFAAARFIAISGYAQQGDIERSLAVGFDVHLAKPVDVSAVIAAFQIPSGMAH